jgi:hypothetical protein
MRLFPIQQKVVTDHAFMRPNMTHALSPILIEEGRGIGIRDPNEATDPVYSQGTGLDESLHGARRNFPPLRELLDRVKVANRLAPRIGYAQV